MNSDPSQQSDSAPERLREARNYFKGFAEGFGVDIVNEALSTAEKRQEEGLSGVTIPSEDTETYLLIEDGTVSFRTGDWGLSSVPIDTARMVLIELQEENAAR